MNVNEEMDQIHTDIVQNHTFPRAIKLHKLQSSSFKVNSDTWTNGDKHDKCFFFI